MDMYRIVEICALFLASYVNGTFGLCKNFGSFTETPTINMCQQSSGSAAQNSYLYLDSSSGTPNYAKVECSCQMTFTGGSGTIDITYRADQSGLANCGAEFSIGNDTTWGCDTTDFSVPAQGHNNITYIKKFDQREKWSSCLGIRSAFYQIDVTCYPYKIYYAPDEVVNGVFGDWSNWSDCSATCGSATQTRQRKCDNPAPRNGGEECLATNGARVLEETATRACSLSDCPVNGGWDQWSTYSQCSATCGDGTRSRTRNCNSPAPQNDGAVCVTSAGTNALVETDTVSCTQGACPVNGGWDQWSTYSQCSTSCGDGTRSRTRNCNSPVPQNNGAECVTSDGTNALVETDTVSCTQGACPVSGGWDQWSAYSQCSATCGYGTRSRTRNCNSPVPQNNGAECVTSDGTNALVETDTVSCTQGACPEQVDGGFADWSTWTTCTVTCDGGSQERTRTCTNPEPQNGGQNCTGSWRETQQCNTNACPVNGGWSYWSAWSSCSQSCGGAGTVMRSRTCDNPEPAYGGAECNGFASQSVQCGQINCPVNGSWGSWSAWNICSKSCGGGGTRTRTRTCNNPTPRYGGTFCPDDSFETTACGDSNCPVNGSWGSWSAWNTCSKSCGGGGTQTRTRTCNNPTPQYGGTFCPDDSFETTACGNSNCPVDGGWGPWSTWNTCSKSCGGGTQTRTRTCNNPTPQYGGAFCPNHFFETIVCGNLNCPIDGRWSEWSAWNTCSKSCGGDGTQTRTRTCNNPPPQYGGAECAEDSTESQTCGNTACPINGSWGSWLSWSECSQTCGSGIQTRYRACDSPVPQHGGQNCTGNSFETKVCYGYNCPVDGQWSQWSPWTSCSVTCASGTYSRYRQCNSPAPQNNGLNCYGDSSENGNCIRDPCPVNGNWGPWSPWSPCSNTCGSGMLARTRLCNAPTPQNGGNSCIGPSTVTAKCYIRDCPVNGNWGLWSPWSPCVITCGSGIISRIRECNNPEPSNEGDTCIGQSTESKNCLESPCPVDGVVGPWSPWSVCSASCGVGERSRTRFCNNPPPSNGGKNCSDLLLQTGDCNITSCRGTESSTSTSTGSSTGASQSTGGSGETPATEASSEKDDSSNTGAIIGGVLGGLAFLILIILLIICICLCCIRRRRRREEKPSTGPRSVRYVSHGDDVTVTENELYHYDGETPSHATNALFVGGIPDTPNSPGHIPHFSTGAGDSYAVIMDSNRTKPKSKERPKLEILDSQKGDQEANGDVRASADTVKLAENYNEDPLGHGVENPAYDENYLAPYDSTDGETKPKTSSSSSPSPYDYIDHKKLEEDDERFERENLAGDYATLPDDIDTPKDTEETDRYKRFISSETEESPDDGYLKSPKREKSFEFPDTH